MLVCFSAWDGGQIHTLRGKGRLQVRRASPKESLWRQGFAWPRGTDTPRETWLVTPFAKPCYPVSSLPSCNVIRSRWKRFVTMRCMVCSWMNSSDSLWFSFSNVVRSTDIFLVVILLAKYLRTFSKISTRYFAVSSRCEDTKGIIPSEYNSCYGFKESLSKCNSTLYQHPRTSPPIVKEMGVGTGVRRGIFIPSASPFPC